MMMARAADSKTTQDIAKAALRNFDDSHTLPVDDGATTILDPDAEWQMNRSDFIE